MSLSREGVASMEISGNAFSSGLSGIQAGQRRVEPGLQRLVGQGGEGQTKNRQG